MFLLSYGNTRRSKPRNGIVGVRVPSDFGEEGGGGGGGGAMTFLPEKNYTVVDCVILQSGIHTHSGKNA